MDEGSGFRNGENKDQIIKEFTILYTFVFDQI